MVFSIIFLSSYLISSLAIPIVLKIGNELSILDKPNFRKEHTKPLVRLGGVAIFLGFWLPAFILSQILVTKFGNADYINAFFSCTFLFFLLGILEDIFHLSFFIKLTTQVFIALYAYSQGLIFNLLDLPLSNFLLETNFFNFLEILVTVIWVVGIVNAFNWIDGLDGLASGTVITTSLGLLFILNYENQSPTPLILILALIGSNLGFIQYNFHPARIFMGDSGSFFIGSFMAFLSINQEIFPLGNPSLLNLISKVMILGLPLLDMSHVIFSRIIQRKSPFFPDRGHFHHRLIDLGIDHKKAVLYCYLIQIGLLVFGLGIFNILN